MKLTISIMLLAASLSSPVRAANVLSAVGKEVLDSGGNSRATFSDTETITFRFQVNNTEDAGPISFTFRVFNPSGSEVLTHTGNTAPALRGRARPR